MLIRAGICLVFICSLCFSTVCYATEATEQEESVENPVVERSGQFYNKTPYVSSFFGDNFYIPYTCHVKMVVAGENTGGTMSVNLNVNGRDRYYNFSMNGKSNLIDLGTVNAGTHKIDIWTTGKVVISIYEP